MKDGDDADDYADCDGDGDGDDDDDNRGEVGARDVREKKGASG